jgi:hypothetical protein
MEGNWYVTQCILAELYQRFEAIHCLNLQQPSKGKYSYSGISMIITGFPLLFPLGVNVLYSFLTQNVRLR